MSELLCLLPTPEARWPVEPPVRHHPRPRRTAIHRAAFGRSPNMRRHENRSTILTSKRSIDESCISLVDVPSASAILDWFLHHAQIALETVRTVSGFHFPGMLLECPHVRPLHRQSNRPRKRVRNPLGIRHLAFSALPQL